jgi:protein tyrosine kinase modulator
MKDFSRLSPEDYVRMFWRRKWYAILTGVLITGVAVVYASRLPHIYRSQTTLLVQAQGISEGYVKPLESGRLEERLGAVTQELQSRSLLERVIRGLNLYGYGTDPTFSIDDAVAVLRDSIEVKQGTGGTITIAFRSTKPQVARDVTQRLADEVIRSRTSSREEQAVITDQFLDQQLHQTEKDLALQEGKLKAFKMQNLGALPEQNSANLAALNGVHNQLINNESALQRAQDQQLILEQRLQDIKRFNTLAQEVTSRPGLKDASGGTIPSDPRRALVLQLDNKRRQLADLELKYTDKFPDVVRLKKEIQDLDQQLSRLPLAEDETPSASSDGSSNPGSSGGVGEGDTSAIKAQLIGLKREISNRQKEHEDLLQQIQVYQGRLNISPRVEQELLSITRDYQSLKEHYQSLQDKRFNSQVAANLEKSKINEVLRVVDPAYLPETPVGPDRRRIAMMGLFAGFVLGLGVVIVLEYFDPTLGDEDTASAELNLPVLVSFPEMTPDGKLLDKSGQRTVRRARRA